MDTSDDDSPSREPVVDARSRRTSSFRRHPVRWTVAVGGLALGLALGGYGVTQAATSTAPATDTATSQGRPPVGASGSAAPSGSPPGGSRGGAVRGTGPGGPGGRVTAINGDTITLTTMTGKTVTVTVTSSTVFKDGTTSSTQSALHKGDLAMVTGSTSSDGTVTATTVTFGSAPNGHPGTATQPPGA